MWNVYGAYEAPSERSHVISDFIHQALATGQIKMMTNGEELRQFIYIDDVCRAFEQAIYNRNLRVCDVSSFEWVSIRHVANIISEITNANVISDEKEGSTPITPMKGRIPGWFPSISLEDGLKRTVEHYRKQYNH